MKLIITIPAYNEEKTIGNMVTNIKMAMNKTKYNYKILVVNDGSTDKTEAAAKQSGAVVYSHPRNYGLAETFKTEIEKCLELKAGIIVHTDADGQYLAEEIPKLIKVNIITKSSQNFIWMLNIPKDHKKIAETTTMISKPPPKGVPTFQPLNLSKRGVGLLKISTVDWFCRLNFIL